VVIVVCCGAVVLWRCGAGAVVLRCCRDVCCAAVVMWCCGDVVLWCCDDVDVML
jgi:hypothetical protein